MLLDEPSSEVKHILAFINIFVYSILSPNIPFRTKVRKARSRKLDKRRKCRRCKAFVFVEDIY
jgi:hypothetical protein